MTNETGSRLFEEVKPPAAFVLRIEELCRQEGVKVHRLAEQAGVAGETLRQWVEKAKTGDEHPGTVVILFKLAQRYGKTMDWFYSMPTEVPGGVAMGTFSIPQDTLSMASEAAMALSETEGISEKEAWDLVRDLRPASPNPLRFFLEGYRRRKKLLAPKASVSPGLEGAVQRQSKKLPKRT